MVEHGTRIFMVEVSWMKVIQTSLHFSHLACYIRRIYATILSEIDKKLLTKYFITVGAILDLPVAILGNTVMGKSKWAR